MIQGDNNNTENKENRLEKLNYNFLTDKEDDIIIEENQIDYDGLIYLDKKDFSLNAKPDFIEKENDEDIAFYCKSCKKITDIVDVTKDDENQKNAPEIKFRKKQKNKSNKIHLKCEICNKAEIIIGTIRGLNEHFHLT